MRHTHRGWRRPIGCLKLHVIFGKRATNYRHLWRKMPCKDKASYDSTPPCNTLDQSWHIYKCATQRLFSRRYPPWVSRVTRMFFHSETYIHTYIRINRWHASGFCVFVTRCWRVLMDHIENFPFRDSAIHQHLYVAAECVCLRCSIFIPKKN